MYIYFTRCETLQLATSYLEYTHSQTIAESNLAIIGTACKQNYSQPIDIAENCQGTEPIQARREWGWWGGGRERVWQVRLMLMLDYKTFLLV